MSIKLNAFDTFDGELLFTFLELEVACSMDDDGQNLQVWLGDFDITHLVDPEMLLDLEASWTEGKGLYEADRDADYGDYLYEQEKDRRLDS